MDSIKLAIFTDTHLGHVERDAIRGGDSYRAFEECLRHSVDQNVDAVLHAGDMFDEAVPLRYTYIKAMEILQRYVIGTCSPPLDIPCFDGLSAPPNTTHANIALPFFVIHGNHDQPSGFGLTTACDLCATVGLVNYIKRVDIQDIVLKPVVLRRGQIDVCVYGFGYILERAFLAALEARAVTFERFPTDPDRTQYNILLLHQNRPTRDSQVLSVPHLLSGVCGGWMNLIVWGHEHENRIDLETSCGLSITQPGSTVVTRLREFETAPRAMAILEIFQDYDNFDVILLADTRPFVCQTITMGEEYIGTAPEGLLNIMRDKIREMLDATPDAGGEKEKLPLVRLRVLTSELDMSHVNYKNLRHEFAEQVANPETLIDVSRKAKPRPREEAAAREAVASPAPINVESILEKTFADAPLSFLVPETLNHSLTSFTKENDKDAFDRNVQGLLKLRLEYLMQQVPEGEAVDADEATSVIERERGNLPFLDVAGQKSGVPGSQFAVVEEESQPEKPRRRKQQADEPLPPAEPPKPKRKAKAGTVSSFLVPK
jgi:double-strand break repair protein MRE11